jgi:hypothetical protein
VAVVWVKYGANASEISSAELAKSRTKVSVLPGQVRLSRDSVCTALTPDSFLSTCIVCSRGWSKPVWYFSATTSTWYSSEAKHWGSSFTPNPLSSGSRYSTLVSGSVTVPEKATSARTSR